jgi:predicted Zn-dependent protease
MSRVLSPIGSAASRPQDGPPFPASRFLSVEECRALIKRIESFAQGGGTTTVFLDSMWTGNLRWARNHVISAGDVRNNTVNVTRVINGADGASNTNQVDDWHLRETVQRAERMEEMQPEIPEFWRPGGPFIEAYLSPKIWFDTTYQQDATRRTERMQQLVQPAVKAGMMAAGYIQVSATGRSSMDADRVWYYPYTQAQYSVTVRAPDGSGSGWAGVDWNDWSRIDTEKLSAIALDKCLRSRNPVRLEPGRYVTILEPQAVGDLIATLLNPAVMDRQYAEFGDPKNLKDSKYYQDDPKSPFNAGPGYSRIGQKVIDERLTVVTDPMDPDLGFPPFEGWQVYHPVTWIQDGILKELAYYRSYAVKKLGRNSGGLPFFGNLSAGAFHMKVRGETATIDEMIATTKRGVLVTRFSGIGAPIDEKSLLLNGYTRDGTWLIENGKISHPIKNFRFTESPLFVLNNVEQIGVPQRIFHPGIPIVVPALKVRDFSFTSLSDAV